MLLPCSVSASSSTVVYKGTSAEKEIALTVTVLVQFNKIANPDLIYPGQVLLVP